MIRTEKEYKESIKRIKEYETFFATRKKGLMEKERLSEENAKFALQPPRLLYEQLKYEVEQYERIKLGTLHLKKKVQAVNRVEKGP
jgi:hypothetical protein